MAIVEAINLKRYFQLNPGLLAKIFHKEAIKTVKAVDKINFEIKEGQIVGLAGESGCGKTTTGMLLTKLYEPTEGKIFFLGEDITKLEGKNIRSFRQKAQIIFQDPYESLNPRFTTFDLLAEPLKALKIGNGKRIEERVVHTLKLVGLKPHDFKDRFPHQMSGGERQRVGIASALIVEPDFVVADEPVSMLDVSVRAGILDLIENLSDRIGFTCLYISHDLSILSNISHQLMIMYLGKIVEIGPTKSLIEDPLHPYSKALISAVPTPDPASRREPPNIKGEVSKPIDLPKGCRFKARCPRFMKTCDKKSPELKKVTKDHKVACHLY